MKNSLTVRMVLWVTLSVIAIFASISSYDYWLVRSLLNQQLRQLAELEVSASEAHLSDILNRLQSQANLTAALIQQVTPSQPKLEAMIQTSMQQYQDAYGMAIIVEPNSVEPNSDTPSYASYFYRNDQELSFVDLTNEPYNLRQKEWYLQARQLDSPRWTDPYFDEGGGEIQMTTYLVPIQTNDSFILTTIDLAVSKIQQMLARLENGKHGMSIYAITPGGNIISGHDEILMLRQINEFDKNKAPKWYSSLLNKIKQRESGSFSDFCPRINDDCWISYTALGDTQWTLLVTYSLEELTSQLITYSQHRFLQMMLGIALVIIVIWGITRRQMKPLKELDRATLEFAKGKLDYALPKPSRNDEIGSLTQSFAKMQVSLKKHIEDLQNETTHRERLNSELRTASQIQQSLLPSESEVDNTQLGIQLSAYLKPARAVGGDLYYYNIQEDEQLLRFVIGDVSDKGIAAAIFMARVVTAIRAIAEQTIDPAEILTCLNRQLVENNDACMFVTLLSGTLDLNSGELSIASAGHPMPFSLTPDDSTSLNPDKSSHYNLNQIEQLNGPAIGLYDYEFESLKVTIKPGSYLIAYTDGLDEAADKQGLLYGESGIKKCLSAQHPSTAQALLSAMINDLSQFVGGAEASDDLTLLTIHWTGV